MEFQPWEALAVFFSGSTLILTALGNPRYTPLKNGWKLEPDNSPLKRTTISESNLHSWVPFVNFPGRIFKVWCSFNLLLGSAQLELQPKEVPAVRSTEEALENRLENINW